MKNEIKSSYLDGWVTSQATKTNFLILIAPKYMLIKIKIWLNHAQGLRAVLVTGLT